LRGVLEKATIPTGPIIEDFRPLADSLDWRLGLRYWNRQGSRAFTDTDGVPYVINNDGNHSKDCAEFLFGNMREQESSGNAGGKLFVLELGVGVGLFARLFLDWFQALCSSAGKDYYDRLVYIAADRHEKILQDLCRNGVFAGHPGRYLLRVVDAVAPGLALRDDLAFMNCADRPFDAVFLNYVLDCLPATILEVDATDVKSICTRARVSDEQELQRAGYTVTDLIRMVKSEDPRGADELSTLGGLVRFEYGFFPPPVPFPYQEAAVEFAQNHNLRHLVHNYGAIECLHGLRALLKVKGFILVADYQSNFTSDLQDSDIDGEKIQSMPPNHFSVAGRVRGVSDPERASPGFHSTTQTTNPVPRSDSQSFAEQFHRPQSREGRTEYHEAYQAFAGTRACGINFPLLKHYFRQSGSLSVLHLETEKSGITTIAFHQGVGPAAFRIFRDAWDGVRHNALESSRQIARQHVNVQEYDQAALLYGTLLEETPNNWVLIHEVSRLLCVGMSRNFESLIFARAALRLNPYGSPLLWNNVGDILCSLGRCDQALVAYKRAARIERCNMESRISLARTYAFLNNPSAALRQICEGLVLCREGRDREILLRMQAECLLQADRRHATESMRRRLAPRSFAVDPLSREVAVQEGSGRNVLMEVAPAPRMAEAAPSTLD